MGASTHSRRWCTRCRPSGQDGSVVAEELRQPRRRRGRPRGSDGRATAERLLAAATSICVEHGFDGTTLALIAERADVSPSAIYNHFESREDLLYAAAVRGIERITSVAREVADDIRGFPAIAAAYLRPDMRETRRLILELEMASGRDDRLAELMGAWHRAMAKEVVVALPETADTARARVKAMFLVLLGLCHLEDLSTIRASTSDVTSLVEEVVGMLVALDAADPGDTGERQAEID